MNIIWQYLRDVFALTASRVSGIINAVINGLLTVRRADNTAILVQDSTDGGDRVAILSHSNYAIRTSFRKIVVGTGVPNSTTAAGDAVLLLDGTAGVSIRQRAAGQYAWAGTADAEAAADTGLERLAAGVVGPTNGSTGTGWLQNEAGEASLESDFTRADDTMTATALSVTLLAGRSYRITGCLKIANSTASDGCKIDFNGGAATVTTFFAGVTFIGTVTAGIVVSEALDTDLTATVVTGTDMAIINGYVECDAGGTFILRAAEVTDGGGTLTIGAGSWLALSDTVDK